MVDISSLARMMSGNVIVQRGLGPPVSAAHFFQVSFVSTQEIMATRTCNSRGYGMTGQDSSWPGSSRTVEENHSPYLNLASYCSGSSDPVSRSGRAEISALGAGLAEHPRRPFTDPRTYDLPPAYTPFPRKDLDNVEAFISRKACFQS